MLVFNLKKEWFDKIKSGKKTHEYREVKRYWNDRFVKEFFNIDKKKKPYDFEIYKQGMMVYLLSERGHYNRPKICFMNGMFSEKKTTTNIRKNEINNNNKWSIHRFKNK